MSEWYEAKEDDISIDLERKEVDILVHDNNYGNVYVTITFDQIKRIAAVIGPPTPV